MFLRAKYIKTVHLTGYVSQGCASYKAVHLTRYTSQERTSYKGASLAGLSRGAWIS